METATPETGTSTAVETSSTETAPAPVDSQQPAQETGEAAAVTPETGKASIKLPASLKPPQKTGRFQQRISDLVQSRKQAEEENRRLREQLEEARRGSVRPTQGMQTTRAVDPNAPLNPDDFDTYADYVNAVVEQTVSKREAARQQQTSQAAYEQYRAEKQQEFEQYAAPLAEQYGEGFWDAITNPNLPVSEAMAEAVMELGEMAPFTMLYLAANPKEAASMYRMNPRQATIAIGRLSAKLTAELQNGEGAADSPAAAQPSMTPSNGMPRPTPVPTVRGSSPANSLDHQPTDKDDIHTWLQKETNRLRRMNPNARFYGAH